MSITADIPAPARSSPPPNPPQAAPSRSWLVAIPVVLLFLWTYIPTFQDLMREWQGNPNYSVGMIVPFAVLFLVWMDRARWARVPIRPSYTGLIVLLAGQLMRVAGMVALFESAERYSILVTLAGLVILMGGWRLFLQTKWLFAILLLMVPFPGRIHNAISSPLQDISTDGAVATLELMGISVVQEGHVLLLNGTTRVAVAEACGGLRMLTAFIFISAVFAYNMQRPAWQKIVVLLSAVPIAILSNLIRLVATALLFMWTNDHIANRFFHDFAGWTMMPLAIAMLFLLLWVLGKLEVKETNVPR